MTDPTTDLLAARYGRRPGRRWLVLLVGAVLAVAGLGWLIWVALEHSRPPVSSQLLGFQVDSATEVTARIEVERRQNRPASCRIQAKSRDFSIVGEATVRVPAEAPRRHTVTVPISTQREATSITLIGCTTEGSQRPR